MNATEQQLLEALTAKLNADIEQERKTIVIHDALEKLLQDKWQLKKLNARIAEQLKERLGWVNAIVRPEKFSESTYELLIWAGESGIPFDKRLVFFIDQRVNSCEDSDLCHGAAAKERNKARKALLASGNLVHLADAILAARNAKANLAAMTEHEKPCNVLQYFAEELV